jgi:hypothetical protein
MLQLGQLVAVTDGCREDSRTYVLDMIVSLLDVAAGHSLLNLDIVGTPFMTILRDGPIETLREMNARAEELWNMRDESMAESESDDGDSRIRILHRVMVTLQCQTLPMPCHI